MKNVIFIGSIAVIVIGFIVLFNNGADNEQALLSETLNNQNQVSPAPQNRPAEGDLKVEILAPAKDKKASEAEVGDTLEVHYKGTLLNGIKFDSSYDRNETFKFTLGAGQVIKGWDQGLINAKKGDKLRLTIPSDLAYGERGVGAQIPPFSTLVFEVEILDIVKGVKAQQ